MPLPAKESKHVYGNYCRRLSRSDLWSYNEYEYTNSIFESKWGV